ncbi:hypothetical protein PCO85_14070 [Prodigiosinella aquatilis]|nr:hypothetical protein [Prodigiosinella sp. LS101]WJV52361.1 hypothetical protein PCO85_14070 [Prodigiosinella sp. LS101]WJV56715.1 hypothetical protein PCO84_14055 [Pectobacteriaceae bacterium C111]
MRIDATQFPFVWMQIAAFGRDPDVSPFTELEALLARKEVFVFLNDEGIAHDKHAHSPEEMKQTTRWMKAHKSELQAFVKASIHIEPNNAKRIAAKPFSIVYEKFWGYPLIMTSSKEEALVIAQKLLSEE